MGSKPLTLEQMVIYYQTMRDLNGDDRMQDHKLALKMCNVMGLDVGQDMKLEELYGKIEDGIAEKRNQKWMAGLTTISAKMENDDGLEIPFGEYLINGFLTVDNFLGKITVDNVKEQASRMIGASTISGAMVKRLLIMLVYMSFTMDKKTMIPKMKGMIQLRRRPNGSRVVTWSIGKEMVKLKIQGLKTQLQVTGGIDDNWIKKRWDEFEMRTWNHVLQGIGLQVPYDGNVPRKRNEDGMESYTVGFPL